MIVIGLHARGGRDRNHGRVGRGECVVHVCPEDAKRLEDVPWRSGTVVEADTSLSPGGVQITTPRGLLVRDMELALASIREQLLEEFA